MAQHGTSYRAVDTLEIPTPGADPESTLRGVLEAARALRERHPDTRALGITLPGTLNTLTGIAGNMPHLPGEWEGVNVRAIAEGLLGLPVATVNDSRAFTLAEATLGAGRDARIVVGITLGTGIGNGTTVRGELLENESGNTGGDFGHHVVMADGDTCACGGRGCLETLARSELLIRATGLPSTKDVFEAAQKGEVTAARAVAEYIDGLAIGMANLHTVICPDVFVVGGGVAAAGDQILVPLREAVRSRVRFDDPASVNIVAATLGSHSGAIGAALCAR